LLLPAQGSRWAYDSLLINFNAKDGAQRVSLDEVLGSSSDGLAPFPEKPR
jgi:hypothetical protein